MQQQDPPEQADALEPAIDESEPVEPDGAAATDARELLALIASLGC